MLEARGGRFGWFGLSVELHVLVVTTAYAVHLLRSNVDRRPAPAIVPIELVPSEPSQEGRDALGVGDSRLLASAARAAPHLPRAPSGALTPERHPDATPQSDSRRVATAAVAPVSTADPALEPPPAAVEPGPALLVADAEPSPSRAASGGQAAGYRAAGSLGLSLAGFGRGAGSGLGDGVWDGGGSRRRQRNDFSRNASIGGWVFWDCPFPAEAAESELTEVVVHARALVTREGRATSVVLLDDPGLGFGRAARACVLEQQLVPARDRNGAVVDGRTDLFRVVFHRM